VSEGRSRTASKLTIVAVLVRWCKRHAGILAIALGVISLLLAVVLCFQAAMLHTNGWRIPLGTVLTFIRLVRT
jgi:hypothetical protein